MHQIDRRRRATSSTSLPSNLRMLNTDRNRIQKLLKEELRMTIMAKRQARGEGEIKVDFPQPKSHELTLAEQERRERRREQNRRAAQRCRRKKRMNQMSVMQNYEWILTHNEQLQQEVDQLRQEKCHLQTVIKAHCDACTCTHTLTQHTLHAATAHTLPATPVKMEPGEEGVPAELGTRAQATVHVPESWQYQEGGVVSCSPESREQKVYSLVSLQGSGSQPSPFPAQLTCGNSLAQNDQGNLHTTSNNTHGECVQGESSTLHTGVTPGQHFQHSPGHLTTMTIACSNVQGVTGSVLPAGSGLLEELGCGPGGVRGCLLQDHVSTPLSADGRRSISSVSSDVSTMSEQGAGEEQAALAVGDFLVTPDMSSNDVSQLLSQINHTDLLFHHDGALDDVFADSTITALPEHFLNL